MRRFAPESIIAFWNTALGAKKFAAKRQIKKAEDRELS